MLRKQVELKRQPGNEKRILEEALEEKEKEVRESAGPSPKVSAPAKDNIYFKKEEKRTRYKGLKFELDRLYPKHIIHFVVMIINYSRGI